ncbi:MAG: tripartite tricarboxylate transporter TctB family protein [Clostridiaceae bacterium]|nr:tripartite tricarboxylate transporter TctB family protein [Clostridiaceae bacterium]
MLQKYRDVFAGGLLMIFSVVLFISALSIKSAVSMSVGPDFMPKLASALLFVLGAAIAVQGYLEAEKKCAVETEQEINSANRGREAQKTIVLMTAYAVLIQPVGFWICTVFYVFFQMLLLAPAGKRKPVMFGLIALISASVIYLSFTKGFHLMLPSGILG